MASIVPYSLGLDLATGAVDLDTHSFKVMLLTSSYTPNKTHAKRSDLSNEVSGTGYSAGGSSITVSSVTRSSGTTSVAFSTVTWASANGFTAAYGAIYRARGGASSADELVAVLDFTDVSHPTGVAASGGDYVLTVTTPLRIVVP